MAETFLPLIETGEFTAAPPSGYLMLLKTCNETFQNLSEDE